MSVIVPTVTVETTEALTEAINRLKPFVRRVHMDISDGEFTPTFLINETQMSWPAEWEVDVHAMITRPSEHLGQIIAMKPSLIVLHAEAKENIVPQLETIKKAGIKAGVALLKTTVPAKVADAIKASDHVMIFSGELGYHGGTASMMQLEKIRLIKKINPKVEIGWDGGVKVSNAYTLSQGGVEVLNVGGEIANSNDPADTYNRLVREINKHGVL